MSSPSSRQNLIDYCLRSLGSPVIEINVDDDQIDDRIDEAIQYYQNFHTDAVVRNFYKHQVTADDFANKYITVPDSMIYILRVLPIAHSNTSDGLFSVDYQMHMNDLFSLRNPGNLVNYEMTRQYLSLIDMTVNGMDQGIIFSRNQGRIHINTDWTTRIPTGTWIVIECYQTLNPNDFTKVYNDQFLKRYATALIKRQWGQNLSKFKGMVLPGGVTIDGTELMTQAKEELKDLEVEANTMWATPIDFYVG